MSSSKDVLAGLPPLGGIKHQIDFVPESVLPNRPAYRMSPEEGKELEKKVMGIDAQRVHYRESQPMCSSSHASAKEGWNLEEVFRLPRNQHHHQV